MAIPTTSSQPDRLSQIMLVCACVFELILGFLLAMTNLPFCDEGFYGVPAQVLAVSGALGNPVLESAGVPNLRGIDQFMYWMAPLGVVLQAAAFKLAGFGLLTQRGLSVFCGLGAVLFWYLALQHLVTRRVAALAALLLSLDFIFLSVATRGRSDIVSLFFGMAALAAYLHWREKSLTLALATSNIACALSGMVHPNGGIAALISLAVVTFYVDGRRLRWSHLAVVAACYGGLGAAWGLYIARAPDLFLAQFFGNVRGRYAGSPGVVGLLKGELSRYLSAFGSTDTHGPKNLRYLLPILYFGAALHSALSKNLRRRSLILLLMFAGVFLSLTFLEGAKQSWYLVHLCPLWAALLALSMSSLWERRKPSAKIIAAAQMAIVLLGVASLLYTAGNRHFQRLYQPTIAFLNAHLTPGDLVFASSEFYFGLNCKTCLKDDDHLGYVTGRRASYIVLEPDYESNLARLRAQNPPVYESIQRYLIRDYREVFHNGNYRVEQWNATSASNPGATIGKSR